MSVRIASLPEPRRFVHQDLILCGTTTTFATISWAIKYFLLSKYDSPITKIPYVISAVLGWSAAQHAFNAFKFYRKRRYLAAPLLHPTINKNEKAFQEAFRSIERNSAYPLMFVNEKNQPSEEQKKDYFRKALSYGTCAGEAITLLKLVAEHPSTSCSELLESLNQENRIINIFRFQMLHIMHSRLEALQEALIEIRQRPYAPNGVTQMLQFMVGSIRSLNDELHPAGTFTTKPFEITQPISVYLAQLDAFIRSQPVAQPICGRVYLATNAVFGNGQFIAGHEIFFQCDQGHYRFYDPINPGEGFYDKYPDKNCFIEALRSQLMEDVGRNASVRFAT